MEQEKIMLNKVSQAQKNKGCMFSLIGGKNLCKINVHRNTYMILYTHTKTHSYICEGGGEDDCISLRGLWEGWREKENERINEKYSNTASMCEDNRTQCTHCKLVNNRGAVQ
jgi:hypothetical protein